MTTPLRPMWQALATAIHPLNDQHKAFPRVLIDQIELRPTQLVKDAQTYEGTFLIDVVTKSDTPLESLELLEAVLEIVTKEQITVEGYTVQELSPEAATPLPEIEAGIWRQLQRYRIKLTKKE